MKTLPRVIAAACLVSLFGLASPSGAAVPDLEFTETGCEGYSDSVARLYTAGLGREPEEGGFEYWMGLYTEGDISLLGMSDFFVSSPEFDLKYGDLDQLGFVNRIYLNVLGRLGEPEGVEYWDGLMTAGVTRGELLVLFAESTENITNTGTVTPTLGTFNKGLDRAWTCAGWPKPDPVDPAGPVLPQPVDPQPVVPQPVVPQPVVPQPVAPQPVVPQPVAPQPVAPTNPGNTKNCGDFSSHAQAQAWFDKYFPFFGDVAKLDRDKDGVACESLP